VLWVQYERNVWIFRTDLKIDRGSFFLFEIYSLWIKYPYFFWL